MSEKLETFAGLLKIPNALNAYEYIQNNDGLPVEGREYFEEISIGSGQSDQGSLSKFDADVALGYYSSGCRKMVAGDIPGAVADLTKAIEIGPGVAAIHHSRGLV